MDANAFKKRVSSDVSVCLFGGKATVLLESIAMPMLASSRWMKGKTPIVSAVTTIIPIVDVVQVGESLDASQLDLLSDPLQHQQEWHAE